VSIPAKKDLGHDPKAWELLYPTNEKRKPENTKFVFSG
jgi:hypothetical protein